MKYYITIVTWCLVLHHVIGELNELANRENAGTSSTTEVSQSKSHYIKAHDNSRIPKLGLRFSGYETDYYITNVVKFVLMFTDVRMIELPRGREELVVDAWRTTNIDRKELFFVSKLNFRMVGVDETRYELDNLLERCGLDYIDLYMIHFLDTKGFYVITWKTMIDLQRQGKVKYLGVSNALHSYVTFLYRHTGILPSVVQLEINPFFQQALLVEQYQDMGIVVQAYSVMAAAGKLHEPRLQRIAKKYNITSAQLLIQWCLGKSFSCLVTSTRLHRVAENFHPVNVTITDGDVESLNELEENLVHHFDPFNAEHLRSVDSFIEEKMKVLEDEGFWESEPLSNRKHISVAEDYDPSTDNFDENQNKTNENSIEVSEASPMYMSSDVDTEITPEVLQIIRDEEKKLKANGLYDEEYKNSINNVYESLSEESSLKLEDEISMDNIQRNQENEINHYGDNQREDL